jgi:hypothetical protein
VSVCVQALPSSQVLPVDGGLEQRPAVQTSDVQTSPSLQSLGVSQERQPGIVVCEQPVTASQASVVQAS